MEFVGLDFMRKELRLRIMRKEIGQLLVCLFYYIYGLDELMTHFWFHIIVYRK